MASARRNIDLNLLVWDLVEQSGYNPSESMFEDVIMSFAAMRQDTDMYAALTDMETVGFVPSHLLIRYIALQIALPKYPENIRRLEYSYKRLTHPENTHMRSTESMNALILGYGIKRDINSAFLVFEDFDRFNLCPDINTFTFLIESLYMDAKDSLSNCNVEDVVGATQIILDSIEETGVKKSARFVHEHVRLLCIIGLPDDAKAVLEEAISAGMAIQSSTIFVLSTAYAEGKDFEQAYNVADMAGSAGCGELPRLVNRLDNMKNGPRTRWREGGTGSSGDND